MLRVVFFLSLLFSFFCSGIYAAPSWYLALSGGMSRVLIPEYNNSVRQANDYNSSIGMDSELKELNWGIVPDVEIGFNFMEPTGLSAVFFKTSFIMLRSSDSYAFWGNGAIAQKISSDLSVYYTGLGIKKYFLEATSFNPFVSCDAGVCFSADNYINEESRMQDGTAINTLRKEWGSAFAGFNIETGFNWMMAGNLGIKLCGGYRYAAGNVIISVKDNKAWTGGFEAGSSVDYSGLYFSGGMVFGIGGNTAGMNRGRNEYRELSSNVVSEGIALYDSGSLDKAYSKFREAEKIDPDNEDAKLYLAKISSQKSSIPETAVKALLKEAEEARMNKKYSEAYMKALKVKASDPGNTDADILLEYFRNRSAEIFSIAKDIYASGNTAEALKQAKQAAEYEPDNSEINAFVEKLTEEKKDKKRTDKLYNEAVERYQKEEYRQAIELWQQVLKINPEDADSARNIKLAEEKILLREEQIKTESESSAEDAKKAYEQGRLDEAKSKCELALRLQPDNKTAQEIMRKLDETKTNNEIITKR